MVVVQTPITLDDCHVQAEWHARHTMAYALMDMADGHVEVNDVDAAATMRCDNGHECRS